MTLLDLDASTVGESPTVGRCVCGRKIWDPVSLLYEMGSGCRKKARHHWQAASTPRQDPAGWRLPRTD